MPSDPFYTRKQVPDEFVEGVGETGLSTAQESDNRERKFSVGGIDVRRFDKGSNSGFHPQSDPYYGRKPVPDSLIKGVGETGLTAEEDFENRERKYSLTGVDVRRFDTKAGSGFHPSNDPYYARKSVAKPSIEGVGNTNMSAAQALETRENKAGMFEEGRDPFQILTGATSGANIDQSFGPDASAQARRRSSAIAPDAAAAAANHHHNHEHEKERLPTTAERRDEITPSSSIAATSNGLNSHPAGTYHDRVTLDN